MLLETAVHCYPVGPASMSKQTHAAAAAADMPAGASTAARDPDDGH
jgi:hypothetical protein